MSSDSRKIDGNPEVASLIEVGLGVMAVDHNKAETAMETEFGPKRVCAGADRLRVTGACTVRVVRKLSSLVR